MPIILSETAAKEIKNIIQKEGLSEAVALRVGVKGGGCSGFSYVLDLTEAAPENDKVMECQNIKIFSDERSYHYLDNTEIDFKDDVTGHGFVFKNPNATRSCNCGSSFSV
ncbi:MAG: iron-sulfur cluster assembly accessory protein [Phycisphaerales bacterium]|nr:iron-sulfur cluster assembly accessory protein [Phycisphaerales bacterium]